MTRGEFVAAEEINVTALVLAATLIGRHVFP
jgi:hypothetical protein